MGLEQDERMEVGEEQRETQKECDTVFKHERISVCVCSLEYPRNYHQHGTTLEWNSYYTHTLTETHIHPFKKKSVQSHF